MKNFLTFFFTFLLSTNLLLAQDKSKLDKIIKKDFEILEVNITKISDREIEYTFPNEKITNALETSKVAKIIFKSGRTQEFKVEEKKESSSSNEPKQPNGLEIKQNSVAILPVPFLNSETMASSAEMAKMAQNDIYNEIVENSSRIMLSLQDIRTTNGLLKKAGIDHTNVDETPVEELQKILGVDHIIASKVSYVMTVNNSSYSISDGTIKEGKKDSVDFNDFSSTNSSEVKKFDFNVYFDMYRNGSKIYSKTRQPFWNNKDSWVDAVRFLLKRSPIYSR